MAENHKVQIKGLLRFSYLSENGFAKSTQGMEKMREMLYAPARLALAALGSLTFEPVDTDRFPGFAAWRRIVEAGGTAGACFNGANEAAVALFLDRRIPFGQIARLALDALGAHATHPIATLDDVTSADTEGRVFVAQAAGRAR